MEASMVDNDDDAIERQLLALEKDTAASVVLRCRGVDAHGRRCTRTRVVAREKLYRLAERTLVCHRHAPYTTRTTTRRRQRTSRKARQPHRRIFVVVGVAVGAVALVVAGIHFYALWLCLLGLVMLSLASLCACVLVLETVMRALWVDPDTAGHHQGKHPARSSRCTVEVQDDLASIA